VVAVAGATSWISKLATDSYISALQLQVALLDGRVRELQQQTVSEDIAIARQNGRVPPSTEALANNSTAKVIFKQPTDGAKVNQFTDVEYSVVGPLPKGYRPVLFVRDHLGQYWCWGTAPSGRHPHTQIGVATDSGQQFEIGVLITKERVSFGQVALGLPEGLSYQLVRVTRN